MKAALLKETGEIIASGDRYLIYKYQELNEKKRFFHYLVELRGVRYCLIRRLDASELGQYKNKIKFENARSRN